MIFLNHSKLRLNLIIDNWLELLEQLQWKSEIL